MGSLPVEPARLGPCREVLTVADGLRFPESTVVSGGDRYVARMPELQARVGAHVLDALDALAETSGAPRDHLVERALAEYLGVDHHTLYQVSTAGALVEGIYQGAVTVGMVREHGDFGLGTFEDLDGEMVVLDGRVFRVSSSGDVVEVADDAATPFAVVTRFGAPEGVVVDEVDGLGELTAAIDAQRESANVFFAVRVEGHFDAVYVRAACRTAPGIPLAVATEHQAEFELERVDGTMVGFWSPPYASGVEIAGYHLHFLSADRRAGGHVLDCRGRELRVRIQEESDVHLALPDTAAFRGADLTHDPTADLDRAEH
jgi:acetolactate decarboxylase